MGNYLYRRVLSNQPPQLRELILDIPTVQSEPAPPKYRKANIS
jgi:hypothetical protein